MNPHLKLSLGFLIIVIGLLAIAFSNELARAIGAGHVIALSLAAMGLGAILICLGVWVSGVRIKFPPKNGPPSN
jgi:hypothetical protein